MRRAPILALALTAILWGCDRPAGPTAASQGAAAVGGPFALVDTSGRPVTERTLLGKPAAIFFGFTYCPEVCPTTLAELTAALKALGPDAARLNVVFVSVDPERDTPEQMKLYLSNFAPRIRGLTGTPAQVATAAKAYHVYYEKIPLEGGGYTMDHTSAIFLLDRRAKFQALIPYGSRHEEVVDKLKALIRSG